MRAIRRSEHEFVCHISAENCHTSKSVEVFCFHRLCLCCLCCLYCCCHCTRLFINRGHLNLHLLTHSSLNLSSLNDCRHSPPSHPTTRIPSSCTAASQKPSHGDISGTESWYHRSAGVKTPRKNKKTNKKQKQNK